MIRGENYSTFRRSGPVLQVAFTIVKNIVQFIPVDLFKMVIDVSLENPIHRI